MGIENCKCLFIHILLVICLTNGKYEKVKQFQNQKKINANLNQRSNKFTNKVPKG